MKKQEEFLAEDSDEQTVEKMDAAIKEFFDFVPEMEELNEEFWWLLYYCLTNEDNTGNHRQTDSTMFLWRQTMILVTTLNQYYHLNLSHQARKKRQETTKDE